MARPFEDQLVTKLLEKTKQAEVDWQTTGLANQLTANFADKFIILLTGGMPLGASLKVKNADGDELVNLSLLQEPRVQALYDLAEQFVKQHIDDQLADLINELDKPPHAETHAERARRIDKIMRERDKK